MKAKPAHSSFRLRGRQFNRFTVTQRCNNPTATPCVHHADKKNAFQMTKRAMRVLRHQERQASQAGGKGDRRTSPGASSGTIPRKSGRSGLLSGVLVKPTEIPAKGVFLISHPLAGLHSPGDIFHRSVVFLVHHDAEGSYGLVVNKDRGETLEEALSSDAVPLAPDALKRVLDNPVRTGGPVMSRLAWLHHYEEVGGVRLSEDTEHPVRNKRGM